MLKTKTKDDLRYMASLLSNIQLSLSKDSITPDDLYQASAGLHQLMKTGTDVRNDIMADAAYPKDSIHQASRT
jgi:hypothetical protein